MNRYPNLSLTLLISLVLFIPFILAKKVSEPYPAIILPSGATEADVGARHISFNKTSVWGKHRKDNTWVQIDVATFLAPIPVQYFPAIAKNSFGLNSAEGKTIYLPKGVEVSSNKVTPNEVKDAKHWLRQKLVRSGYASNELMITFERVKFDIETGKIVKIERSDEEIIRLD